MKLQHVLNRAADAELATQVLNDAMVSASIRKQGTAVTFLTNMITPGDTLHPEKMPLILILRIDRAAFDRIMAMADPDKNAPDSSAMRNAEQAFNEVDAHFFTGDQFINNEAAMLRAEWFMARWQRRINEERAAMRDGAYDDDAS